MADRARGDQESMYCHACHHQWQRSSEGIECPVCMSASTEIVSPENDPRHFHGRQQETTAAPVTPGPTSVQEDEGHQDATAPSPAPHEPSHNQTHNVGDATGPENGTTPHPAGERGPRLAFRFERFPAANVAPVTFFTFVTSNIPPPSMTENPLPVTFFGMQFSPVINIFPNAPPPTVNNSPPAEADHTAAQQNQHAADQTPDAPQQQQQYQQPPPIGPHPAPAGAAHHILPAHLLATVLTSLFNPSAAILGDAVYSQEAFDRIITQLREQVQPGGAPPASQSALDRLEVREVDDKMLGDDGSKSKCVVCVDEMVRGEKAAVLPCKHFFHGDCVMPWLKLHGTCPVCRRSVEVEVEDGKLDKGVRGDGAAAAPGPELPATMDEGAGEMDCS